jgi:glycosyltransferase involved in cell wall biosynthesis
VPTKNRHKLIEQLVKSIDDQIPNDIEYIIYDNSDEPLLLNISQCNHIKYFYDSSPLSVGANFSKALSCASGQFVAYMGDDDRANHRELATVLSKYNLRNYDTIVSPIYDLLFHGGSGTRWTGQFDVMTKIVPNKFGRGVLWLIHQFSKMTRKISYFWLLSPDLWSVPRGYFGIFKRELLTPVKNGEVFREIYLSPDAYLMGRLAHAHSTLYVKEQLFMPGTSSMSTSNLSNARQHIGAITIQKHFDQADLEAIPTNVPDSFLPEVIWAASYLSATGKISINPLHLATLEQFSRMKYGFDICAVEEVKKYGFFNLISGFLLAGLFFTVNRVMVAGLVVARYKFSTCQRADDC